MSTARAPKFSAAAIQAFYAYLSKQFEPDFLKTKELVTWYQQNPITIYQVLQSFRNDTAAQQMFPTGIASILTPLHVDTLHSLVGSNWQNIKASTAFKILNHLTIDAGTAEFAKNIDTFAELLYHECGGLYDKPDRACVFRYLEEIKKDKVPDDENQVIFNDDYIYNVTGSNYAISAIKFKHIQVKYAALIAEQIQHYVKPSFEQGVLPAIILDAKAEWERLNYRPQEDWIYTRLADKENKLQRHLQKRITNQTQANFVFQSIKAQLIEPDKYINIYERVELMDLAIYNIDRGKYDNATVIETLVSPKPIIDTVEVKFSTTVKLVVAGSALTALCFLAWRARSFGNWFNAVSSAGSSVKDSMVSGLRRLGVFAQSTAVDEAYASQEELRQLNTPRG